MATTRDGRMPLLDHLRELRQRVFKSSIAIVVASAVSWYFYNAIITLLSRPICQGNDAHRLATNVCDSLYVEGVLGPFNLHIKVAFISGLILSAPIWMYQLWAFIAPALHRKEKRYTVAFFGASIPFFALGVLLGFVSLPAAIDMLFSFTPDSLTNLIKFDEYLDFVLRVILLFGLAFELPVFLVTFNAIGFLSARAILKPWRMWVFAICVFIAGFTPSPDPLSMALLAIPLISLYFLAGGIATLNDKRRNKRAKNSSEALSGPIAPAAPIDSPEDI